MLAVLKFRNGGDLYLSQNSYQNYSFGVEF